MTRPYWNHIDQLHPYNSRQQLHEPSRNYPPETNIPKQESPPGAVYRPAPSWEYEQPVLRDVMPRFTTPDVDETRFTNRALMPREVDENERLRKAFEEAEIHAKEFFGGMSNYDIREVLKPQSTEKQKLSMMMWQEQSDAQIFFNTYNDPGWNHVANRLDNVDRIEDMIHARHLQRMEKQEATRLEEALYETEMEALHDCSNEQEERAQYSTFGFDSREPFHDDDNLLEDNINDLLANNFYDL